MLPADPTPAAAVPAAREGSPRTELARPAAPVAEPVADADLVARLVQRAGAGEPRSLPYVVALLAKVAGRHRQRNAKLGVLCEVGEELADALEAHRDEEEHRLCAALLDGALPEDATRRDLERMSRRHRALELLLARVRWLADDFAVPAWGGRSYQDLMEELEGLEADVLEHLHLEAQQLVPRLSGRCERAS